MPANLPDSGSDPLPGDPAAETPAHPAEDRQGTRLISRLLPPAIRLWLHTQLDHLEGLDFAIQGRDRQILSGFVPEVSLSAHKAVYRGLQVSQVGVTAAAIRVNLGQVLRGKPLRLLQPFPVRGQVSLNVEDVRASLQAPLLAQGLADLFERLLQAQPDPALGESRLPALAALPHPTHLTAIDLGQGQLHLTWRLSEQGDERLRLHTHLAMREGRWLCLRHTTISLYRQAAWSAPVALAEVVMDLGPETQIERLEVTTRSIELAGVVRVIPAA
ncbi:MAG TPA: DUF2993 domain-containing protein [Leptolyngbyaceae cyanobacterium M65_K2018_010]|nr:DUF2993 domain-containing protein [Leptolyngbyaceae cyanobacterium M65_K2018_010]